MHLGLGMQAAKDDEVESVEVRRQPAWFTAPRFTFLLCFMLFWVYVDRGKMGRKQVADAMNAGCDVRNVRSMFGGVWKFVLCISDSS